MFRFALVAASLACFAVGYGISSSKHVSDSELRTMTGGQYASCWTSDSPHFCVYPRRHCADNLCNIVGAYQAECPTTAEEHSGTPNIPVPIYQGWKTASSGQPGSTQQLPTTQWNCYRVRDCLHGTSFYNLPGASNICTISGNNVVCQVNSNNLWSTPLGATPYVHCPIGPLNCTGP